MGFWFSFFFWLGSQVVQALLFKPKVESARPSGLDDFQVPTATEGRVVPIIVGKVKMAGPNVIWYGDLTTSAIKEKVGGFLGIGGSSVTKGYRYNLGLQLAICRGPIGGVDRIWFGDKVIKSGETTGEHTTSIDDPEFFGGENQGGGIDFDLKFYMGTTSQTADSYISTVQSPAVAYRRTAYCVLSDGANGPGYIGNAAQLRNFAFEPFWYPNSLAVTGGKERIGDDANPICFLYEILTNNDDWGVQLPGGSVLVAGTLAEGALRAVAEQVADEGLGFSMAIDRELDTRELIQEIERHVDGAFRLDLTDGRYKIVLARPPAGAVPTLDESNIETLESYTRPNWGDTKNEVRVGYADRAKEYGQTYAFDFDNANRDIVGGRRNTATLNFPGCKTAAVANKLAPRELRSFSFPLARMTARLDRSQYALQRGDPFNWDWSDYGISQLPMRVLKVDYDNDQQGQIKIDAVEDVYRLEVAGFVDPPATGWTPPNADAVAALSTRIWEPPDALRTLATEAALLVARDGGLHLSYDVYADLAGGTNYTLKTEEVDSWTPRGLLSGAVSRDSGDVAPYTTDVDVDGLTDVSLADLQAAASSTVDEDDPQNVILVGDELMWFEAVSDQGGGVYRLTCNRGAFGTVVADHADDAEVWFPTLGAGKIAFGASTAFRVKVTPRTATGALALASAPAVPAGGNYTPRGAYPYAPRDVKVNGELFVDDDGWTEVFGTLRFAWKGWAGSSDFDTKQDDPNLPADGTTAYKIEVARVDNDALVVERAGVPLSSDGGAFNVQGFIPAGTPSPVLDPGDTPVTPASEFAELDFYATALARRSNIESDRLTTVDFSVVGWGIAWDDTPATGVVLDPGDTPVASPVSGKWSGFSAADDGGVVVDQGQAPVIVEPVPGVDVLREVSFTFGGSPTADDEYDVNVVFFGPDDVVNETFVVTGTTPEALAQDLFGHLTGIVDSEWTDNVDVSLVGSTVTASSFFGSLTGTATSVAGIARVRVLQTGENVGASRPEFGHVDFYQLDSDGNEVRAPSSGAEYQDSKSGRFVFRVVGFTHEARVALNFRGDGRPLQSREFSVPYTQGSLTDESYTRDLADLRDALNGSDSWKDYIKSFTLSFTTQLIGDLPSTNRMERTGLTYAAEDEFGISQMYFETTDPNSPTGYKLLSRPHIEFSLSRSVPHVVSAQLLNNQIGGGDALTAGQIFSVTLGGTTYSEELTGGDLAADPTRLDPLIERLAADIETGPYSVELLTLNRPEGEASGVGGRRTFISDIIITSTSTGASSVFTASAQAGYGATVTVEVQ